MQCQNLWGATKAVVRWKGIVLNAYRKKKALTQINNQCFQLKNLEKENQNKSKANRRKETND